MSTNVGYNNPSSSGFAPSPAVLDADQALASVASAVAVKTPEFAELTPAVPVTGAASLDNLLDVTVTVTAELGRSTTSIGELLKLSVGSVVELDRLISEPVELMAQGVRLARGEVVVVEDRFAIRIKEIVDPKKRV
jgi:flagellar motor switch protein FliN/FliY